MQRHCVRTVRFATQTAQHGGRRVQLVLAPGPTGSPCIAAARERRRCQATASPTSIATSASKRLARSESASSRKPSTTTKGNPCLSAALTALSMATPNSAQRMPRGDSQSFHTRVSGATRPIERRSMRDGPDWTDSRGQSSVPYAS